MQVKVGSRVILRSAYLDGLYVVVPFSPTFTRISVADTAETRTASEARAEKRIVEN